MSDPPTLNTRYGTLVSVSRPAPGLTALDFVREARGQVRFYWHDGRDPIIFAGAGAAVELFAYGPLRMAELARQAAELFAGAVVSHSAEPLAAPRLFGGFAFQDDFTPDQTWAAFHPAHFVLPHYQLLQRGPNAWLTINAHVPEGEDPREVIPALEEAVAERVRQGRTDGRQERAEEDADFTIHYPLSGESWTEMITTATGLIRAGALQKVVLSRVCEIQSRTRLPITAALTYLNEAYPDCYRFLFEPRPHHAFLGATPELLVRVDGRALTTMGLAGSAPRGGDEAADRASAAALLASAKDRHEHDLVVQAMRERLQPLTARLEIATEPEIYTLRNIHHLHTPVHGELHPEIHGVLPLVEALHPTPALGGTPRDQALPLLARLEPVPRGWYAAPIGWIDHRLDGTFAVAIRSAVIQENRVWAYAGAGIVGDSVPEREWQETALKFKPMLEALGAVS